MSLQSQADTHLDRSVRPVTKAYPGKSGIVTLPDGHDAFAARVLLANAAERTLDVQYYIWHLDMSGTMLFQALRRAADRGVRVRLLLDDAATSGLDSVLATLNAHPNIEVRVFNPLKFRRWRIFSYLIDFARTNRRMHNKSFTADNQATIVGGRNVGDEYFGARQDVLFVDLDVLAIGPVVNEVSNDFERYWTSASACPAERVLPTVSPAMQAAVAADMARAEHAPAAMAYREVVATQPLVRELLAGRLLCEWATTHMVSDDPSKGQGRAKAHELMWPRLRRILKAPIRELQLVSAYFVPGAAGVRHFAAMARQGVRITVLTNSLEATDVPAVHAGYARWRKPLLQAGIALYEMKRAAPALAARVRRGLRGSSASRLHTKTFSVDGTHAFIGSFNFDPRSARLNTELGFVIDSPTIAQAIAFAGSSSVAAGAYQVRLDDSGELQWIEQRDGAEVLHKDEPGAGLQLRLNVFVMSLLPIEWLL